MASFAAPKMIHAGFVLLDATTGAVARILELPLNPETLSRSLEAAGGGSQEPREGISFVAVLDASDALARRDTQAALDGILPELSALELLLYSKGPANSQPILMFVWGARRLLPVRVASIQITEQSFDSKLNPIHAEVSITLVSLKDADLPAGSKARELWEAHLQVLEQLAASAPQGTLADLGLTGV